MSLEQYKDEAAKAAFDLTKREAHNKGICINCKQEPQFYSHEGRKEYSISGLCEFCFDAICDLDTCGKCDKPESFHIHKPNRGECEKFISKPSEFIGD